MRKKAVNARLLGKVEGRTVEAFGDPGACSIWRPRRKASMTGARRAEGIRY